MLRTSSSYSTAPHAWRIVKWGGGKFAGATSGSNLFHFEKEKKRAFDTCEIVSGRGFGWSYIVSWWLASSFPVSSMMISKVKGSGCGKTDPSADAKNQALEGCIDYLSFNLL